MSCSVLRRTVVRGLFFCLVALCGAQADAPKKEWLTVHVLKGSPESSVFTFEHPQTGQPTQAHLNDRVALYVYRNGALEDLKVGSGIKAYGRVDKAAGKVRDVGHVCRMPRKSDHLDTKRIDGEILDVRNDTIGVRQGGRRFDLLLRGDVHVELVAPSKRDLLKPGMFVAFSALPAKEGYDVTREMRFYPDRSLQADLGELRFPQAQPERASYIHPREGQTLDVSPPGFNWWRLTGYGDQPAPRGAARYRLRVRDAGGKEVYASPPLEDPVHVPDVVLPEGAYTWAVDGMDAEGKVVDTWPERRFAIAPAALAQPWVAAERLLARVPESRPRLLFLASEMDAVRAELDGARQSAFRHLRASADKALALGPMGEPDYDEIEDPAERRLAYIQAFWKEREHHEGGMRPLAMMYLVSGEKKYAEVAKAILMEITEWDVEGISSVSAPYGDELGLGIAKAAPQTYDWLYDYLSPEERRRVEENLAARADQILRRLERSDFLYTSAESHNGRLIAFLGEFAVCLPDHPRAPVWLDYSMRGQLTVFPHWGGPDGGWNEGIGYGSAYNNILLPPMVSISRATGFDLWQRPYFKEARQFFMYCIAPGGELRPFGDGEQGATPTDGGSIGSLLRFHAHKFNDPAVGWFAEHVLREKDGSPPDRTYIPDMFAPAPGFDAKPEALAQDRAFRGIGWAAMHSDIADPGGDLFVLFKSSPYGSVSHSYADQNTYVVMKGGAALAALSGAYWPSYGAPFHADYTRHTVSKNGILVGGKGQIVRSSAAKGRLADFQTTGRIALATGDAQQAYGERLERFLRHVVVIKPSLILIADDLAAPDAAEFQWLLQARQEMELDEPAQALVSRRKGREMHVRLFTDGGFAFHQTDEWPLAPDAGYPTAKRDRGKGYPEKQWHFTATTRERATARRIGAILFVPDKEAGIVDMPEVRQPEPGVVEVEAHWPDGRAEARIDLRGGAPMIHAQFQPSSGEAQIVQSEPGR